MGCQFDRQTIYSMRLSSHFLEPNQDKRQKKRKEKKTQERASAKLWASLDNYS